MEFGYILVGCLLLFLIYRVCQRKIIIKRSPINGNGLFANQSFKKGDIIIPDLFPYKEQNRVLRYPPTSDFNQIIISEGMYINHCSINHNSNIIAEKNQLFQLIATNNIHSGQEITANYDTVNQRFPFIASSEITYSQC